MGVIGRVLSGKKKELIFCIGLNKTGTTSLGYLMQCAGYKVAKQRDGEVLLKNYIDGDFNSIIKFCNRSRADFFQDVPFSLPNTYKFLEQAFPNAKFVLTVRENAFVWTKSLIQFHSDFYNNGTKPTPSSVKESQYVYEGWSWDLMRDVYGFNEGNLYDEELLNKFYEEHVNTVEDYFKDKSEKLIRIQIGIENDFQILANFVKLNKKISGFPRITSKDLVGKNYNCDFL